MSYENEAVLEAFGFENKGDHWRFDQDIKDAESDREEHVVVIVKIAEDGSLVGKIPMVADRLDSIRMANFDGPGLYYQSSDVADMIALAQNEVGSQTLEVTGTPSDIGFENKKGDLWVTAPFMGGDWFDYDVIRRKEVESGHKMTLKNPQKNYKEYDVWKAELVENLMTPSAPKP